MEKYPITWHALLAPARLPVLGPGVPNEACRAALTAWVFTRELPGGRDARAARACHAGFWLLHDFLDESHAISQHLPTPEGSYWHAIMHRREPDAWNSKYWFRKVGSHPVLAQLAKQADGLGFQFTDPLAFVDFVEQVRDTGSDDEMLARRVQLLEWQLLFDHCYQLAIL
jgi:hypothetical protein